MVFYIINMVSSKQNIVNLKKRLTWEKNIVNHIIFIFILFKLHFFLLVKKYYLNTILIHFLCIAY